MSFFSTKLKLFKIIIWNKALKNQYFCRPYSEVVNVFGRKNVDTKSKEEAPIKKIATVPENAVNVFIC